MRLVSKASRHDETPSGSAFLNFIDNKKKTLFLACLTNPVQLFFWFTSTNGAKETYAGREVGITHQVGTIYTAGSFEGL